MDDSSNYFLSNGSTFVGNDGQITPRTLTVNYGGVNKVYDGSTTASVTTTDNRIVGDTLSVTRSAAFDDKNAATGKTVNVSAVSLTGADAANYVVSSSGTTTADITPRTLVVGYTGTNKVYDGTTAASVTTTDDRVAGDTLSIANSAAFSDKNVGGAKTISVTGVSLSGTDATNYAVSSTGSTTANITPRTLVVTYGGINKVYDGGTVATVTTSDDRVTNDVLTINRTGTFADKNVGTAKAVAVSGVSLSGTDADNYTVLATGATTADITPKTLTVTYSGINKVYDGTTLASVTSADDRVSGDSVSIQESAAFTDKNAAVGKTINVTGISLSGTDAANYTTSSTATTTADVTPRTLVVSYTGNNKVYDGDTVATVATSDDRVAGDVLSVVRSAAFADKNVATGKTVSVSGVSLSGTDAGNYIVATTGTTSADITPRSLNVTYTGVAKIYDGLLGATVNASDDRVTGDVISIARTATFADKDVATAKPVSVFGISLSGTDAANYSVAAIGSTTADITRRTLNPVFTAISKIYDGTTSADVTSTDDRVSNDVVSVASTADFDTRHVGTGKTVTISGISLSGADAANYSLATTSSNATSRIDQADSVTWVGGVSNNWMDAGNWAMTSNLARTGVLPDGGNVALALLPSGFTGTVTASGGHNHAGKIQVSGGTLSISSDADLGAVPASPVADAIILSGGTLKPSTSLSIAANRGVTLSTFGGTLDTDTGITLSILGDITGAGALNKSGDGSLVLRGALPYTGATTIAAGSMIIRNDAPSFATSGFSGNGTLTIEPVSASFTSPVVIGPTQMPATVSSLTVGKAGNTQSIYLQGNVGTVGTQRYYGPVQLTGRNIGLTTATGDLIVDAINSDGTPRALTMTAGGGGSIYLNGDIGVGSSLFSLTATTSGAGKTYFGSRTRTVYDQIFTGPMLLTGDTTFSSTAGAVSFKGSLNGAYGLTASLSSQGRLIFNHAVGGDTPLTYLTVGANGLTYINADVTVAGTVNVANSIIFGLAGVAQFNNGDFESDPLGSTVISGWNTYNTTIRLGVDSIGGYLTPIDLTYPANVQVGCNKLAGTGCDGQGTAGFVAGTTLTTKLVGDVASVLDGTRSVEMFSQGSSPSYGIVRGPYIVSAGTVSLAGDDQVSFKWKALGGSDAFDVYGYLLNVNTGSTIQLLNATGGTNGFGATAPWTAAAKLIPTGTPMAEYKFIFVSGTWDESGGRALGARLFIDSVKTSSGSTTTLFDGTVCTTCRINASTVNLGGSVNLVNSARLNVANDSVIAGAISGTGGLIKDGAGQLTITGAPTYSGATTLNAGGLNFRNDTAPRTSGFSGTGPITIEPSLGSTSFASDLTLAYTYGTTLSSLTIGKVGNTAGITTNAMTVAGPIRIYGGNIAVNGAMTATNDNVYLSASGNLTDGTSGYISANALALLGGAVTLDHASNSVGTLAASGVRSITFSNAGALTIGTVNPTGISATGDVRIETLTGDLTVAENITTTSTTANAIVLNAGKNTAAGTATGGNILISGTPSITAGTGGTIRLMTGSLAGSTGLVDFVGAGTGRFRYNSDETTTNYTLALNSNVVNAIYREQPTATANVTSHSVTYGFDHTLTLNNLMPDGVTPISTNRAALNGDEGLTGLGIVISGANYSNANKLVFRAAPYTMLDGLAKLGYAMNQTGGSLLTTSKKSIDLVGFNINNKVYDGNANATFSGTVGFNGIVGSDTVSYTSATGTFATRHVGTQAVTVNGVVLAGADQDNYTVNLSSGNGNATISQLASATWIGTGNGNWSNASNWAVTGNLAQTGVVPDGSNVASAIVPSTFTGVLTSSTDHAHAGKIEVNGGTLAVAADTHLGAVPVSAVADRITLNGGTLKATDSFTLNANRGITLGASGGSFAVDASKSVNYAGVLAGTGGLTKSGAGTLTVSGSNSYTGGTTITGGQLVVGAGGNSGSIVNNTSIAAGAGLLFNRSDDVTYAGNISGAGTLSKLGTNTLTLTGTQTYTGSTATGDLGGGIVFTNDMLPSTSGFTGGGFVTIQPVASSSFTTALTTGNYSFANSLSGLTLGHSANTASVNVSSAISTSGPISIYGGSITVTAPLTAGGNILLDGDTGSFLTQNSVGVKIDAAVTTTAASNGDITILGRGGSGVGYSQTHGVLVTDLVEAGGTGAVNIVGLGGLAVNGLNASDHGIYLNGASAWIKSNGGNVTLTGNGGGSGIGSYSQGIALVGSQVSAGGSGAISMTGTGGVNTAVGLRGVVIVAGSSVASAGGAITIAGYNGSNGLDNSDGVTIDNSTIGGANSGAISITGTAGGGAGSEAITIGNASSLTAAGAISIIGGDIVLNANVATTNASTGDVLLQGTTINGANSIQLANGRQLTINNSGSSTLSGVISGTNANVVKVGAGTLTLTGDSSYTGGTTLSAGTVQVGNGGTSGRLGTGTITNDAVLVFKRSDTLTVADEITGSGLIKQEGTGTLIFSATNNYQGGTQINAGTLAISTDRNLGAVPASVDPDNIILNGGNLQLLTGFTELHANRGITLGASHGTITTDLGVTASYGGVITGAANFTKAGSGELALSGANNYIGTTTIAGNLVIAGAGSLNSGAGIGDHAANIVNNGTLRLDTSVDHQLSGVISGSGDLQKLNTNTLTLSGANTYAGGTSVTGGIVKLDSSTVRNAGSIVSSPLGTAGVVITSGAAMDLNGQSVANAFTIAGTGVNQSGVLYNANASAATASAAITLNGDSTIRSNLGGLKFDSTLGETAGGAYALTITGANNNFTQIAPFLTTGRLTIGSAATDSFSFANGLSVTSPSSIHLAGALTSNNLPITIGSVGSQSTIGLVADANLSAGTANVSLNGSVTGAHELRFTSPAFIAGALAVNALSGSGNVTIITGGAIEFGNLTVGGNLSVTTGSSNTNGGISQSVNSTISVTGTSIFVADTLVGQDAALNKSMAARSASSLACTTPITPPP